MDIYGNKVFWAWNNVLNEREIRRQIQGFAQQKIAGFFIHSRCGLKMVFCCGDRRRRSGETGLGGMAVR